MSFWTVYTRSMGHSSEQVRVRCSSTANDSDFDSLLIGPDTLSVNSPSAAGIYLRSDKTETYRYPGHDFEGVALFFKSGQKDAHRMRRKIWSAFFTTAR